MAERNKQRERYRFLIAQEREMQLRHLLRQSQLSGSDQQELDQVQQELLEASRAKEEAEAHARMIQASLANYERLREEVEGRRQKQSGGEGRAGTGGG